MHAGGAPATSFQPSPLYLWGLVMAGSMFCGGGVWMAWSSWLEGDVWHLVIGVLTALLAIAVVGHVAARLIRARPELVLTSEGLMDRHGVWVGWNEVTHIRCTVLRQSAIMPQELIQIWLRDPASYHARIPRSARPMAKLNARRHGHIALHPPALDAPAGQILAAIHHYRPGLIVHD